MGRTELDGDALTTRARRVVEQAEDLDAALLGVLELLTDVLVADAGVAWRLEPGDAWRIVGSRGRARTVGSGRSPGLAPPGGIDAGPLVVDGDGGEAILLPVATAHGEPVAELQLIGVPEAPTTARSTILSVAAALLGLAHERLRERERTEQLHRLAAIGSWEWRADTDRLWLSAQMQRNLDVHPRAFEHSFEGYLVRVDPDDREPLIAQVMAAGAAGGAWHAVHRIVTDEGQRRDIELHGRIALDTQGRITRMWGTGQDVTERRDPERHLIHRLERDALTGLATREAFQRRVAATLARAVDDEVVVVALVDLDGFRAVNELVGFARADRLLEQVADRLREVEDAVSLARLAADEFALLFRLPRDAEPLTSLGERLAARLRQPRPCAVDGLPVTAGVGLASSADLEEPNSGEDLLCAASVALKVTKRRAAAGWQVFDPREHERALQRLAMEADLRRAIEQGDIGLVYQPIVSLVSGEITGVEALARWDRPGHGPVSPATFVPIAERSGLMAPLGELVLERACRQFRAWQLAHPQLERLRMAVNVSGVQLDDPRLLETVEAALARCGLAPDRLVLEVTETALATDKPGALARLFKLRRRGVHVAIDDFGTGYSSLSRLREIPFDILKIDRSFLEDITSRHTPTPILQALFSISDSLGLDVVAEGVETPVQLAVMLAHGCAFAQGYLFSRPLRAEELEPWLERDVVWDPPAIASEATAPRTSPRLQQLLDELVSDDEPSAHVLGDVLTIVAELTGLGSVYLTRIDLRENVQEVVAARDPGALGLRTGLRVPWSDTLCHRALQDGVPVIQDARTQHPDLEVVRHVGIRTYVGVEVRGPKGGLRGTLCGVADTVTEISDETVATLRWIARLLSEPLIAAASRPTSL
jgi:diguanylate cyclase (GGDEF)-like protein